MIYLDTSVVLARLFAEDRSPPDAFWSQTLVASRLLEFEVFTRVNARGAATSHADDARRLIGRVNLLEMSARVLDRALLPFARPVRTLDALHLATMDFLRSQGLMPALATYDQRLAAAAIGEGYALADC
ncbi:MAG: PIN domain-containing protein [Burkholderiaceae bacterium]|nr:PIN domain-containing protein [Burkholderiaceae bacterium]